MRRRLALFVLPTVLFPGTLMPLHIFEPRYRQMVARCLEMDRRFGLLFHDRTEGEFHLDEDAVGCVAEIVQFQPLPDGRSLLVARGESRFRILDGIESDTRFHEALIEEFGDDETPEPDVERRRRTVDLFLEVARSMTETESRPDFDVAGDVSFAIASTFVIDASWQQRLLEMRTESERLDAIDRILRSAGERSG